MSQNLSQATNAILTHLLMELKSGNIRRCEALGMTIDEVRQLSQLTVDDLHYLMQSSVA